MTLEIVKKNFDEAMTKVSEKDLDWLIKNCLDFDEKVAILKKMDVNIKRKIIENLVYEL